MLRGCVCSVCDDSSAYMRLHDSDVGEECVGPS